MPSGYTYGIINGKTRTFPEFAKLCMKAFGACVHMRDDDTSKPYELRVPSDYHVKEIKRAKQELLRIGSLTDDQLLESRRKEIAKAKKSCYERIEKTKVVADNLNKMIVQVKQWTPPTKDHAGLKKFMLEQLNDTLEFDGKSHYAEEELVQLETELQTMAAKSLRDKLVKKAQEDIAYHVKENAEEITRCNESNKWVEDLLKSLE